MHPNADNSVDLGAATGRFSRKTYPCEVEEMWLRETQHADAEVHMRISHTNGENWLEAGPDINAEVKPAQSVPDAA